MKYCIDVEEYTINKLFDKTVSHEDFYKKNHKSIHSWKRVKEQYCEGMGAFRILYYRIDYLISKLIYPGLDAMDYFRYEFYNIRHSKRKTFITEGALKKLNKRFNNEKENYESFLILQDKVKFNDYFEQYIGREWISVENESRETFFNFIRKHKKVICKPQNGTQGHGIEICYPKSDGDIEEVIRMAHAFGK